jgi:PAS domain-containing protein
VEPALWPALLDRLSDLLDAGAINLTRLNLEDGGGTGLVRRTDPEWMSTYFEHYAAINPFTAGPRDTPWRPTVYLDEQVMDRDRYVRTEFYNDFFVHVGSQWSMVLRLSLTDDHVSTIHLGRDDRGGRFEHAALATARRVLPHLVRAYTLSTRLDESRGLGDAVRAGLDHVREALVLTDGTGRIQHANAAAERLLTLGTVLRSDGGRLAAVHPLSAPRLAVLIAAAGSTNEPVSGAMSLPAPGRLPLGVIVTPVQPERPGLFAPAPAVVVSVSDPGGAAPPSPSRLAERHGLTPAESRVAMALYEGMTPGRSPPASGSARTPSGSSSRPCSPRPASTARPTSSASSPPKVPTGCRRYPPPAPR